MAKKNKNRLADKDRRGLAKPSPNATPQNLGSNGYANGLKTALVFFAIVILTSAPLIPDGVAEDVFNWPIHMLGFIAVAIAAGLKLMKKTETWHFSAVDVCFYAVCGWMVFSGLASLYFQTGHARATINATWQWFLFATIYFVFCDLCREACFRTMAIQAAWCVALGCAFTGNYEGTILLPAMQEAYEKQDETQKQKNLRDAGVNNTDSGSRERLLWESRFFSTEPTSTFVLANSLAAYLTPWLLVSIGLLISGRLFPRVNLVIYGMAALIIAACLFLTKSRTAGVACFLGVIFLATLGSANRNKQGTARVPWVLIFGLFLLTTIMILLAIVLNIFDLEVLSEAPKSLLYRLEYWQASGALIRDHLWFGCGPGNFQNTYANYQLAQSSETVADPHNFLIEVWAVGGTPAAIFLILGCFLWIRNLRTMLGVESSVPAPASDAPSNDSDHFKNESAIATLLLSGLTGGILVSLFVCFVNGFNSSLILFIGGISLSAAVAVILLRVNFEGSPLVIALLAFVIGLTASGGISFPSVATTGILLLAVTQSSHRTFSIKVRPVVTASTIFLFLGVIFLFRSTVTDPIQKAKSLAYAAERDLANSNLKMAIQKLELAIKADPYDGNYQFFLCEGRLQTFRQEPSQTHLDQLIEAAVKSVNLRPKNSKVALETGKIFLFVGDLASVSDQNMESLDPVMVKRCQTQAIAFFETAVKRRPNDAEHVAFLAYAHWIAQNREKAGKLAAKALELDELNPHLDRDLENGPFRFRESNSDLNIEQELLKIRKNQL